MYFKTTYLILMFIILLVFTFQSGRGSDIGNSGEGDGSSNKSPESYITFENIGHISYYRNENQLQKIARLEKAGKFKDLIKTLENYVSNFGITNFRRDSGLLWKLAQLYEKTKQTAKAKWLYRLILKHTDKGIEYVKKYYDSIAKNDKEYYVPIDYYYKLIEYRKQIDTLRPARGKLNNMGTSVNSDYEDYGPAINNKNNLMIFTSKRNREDQLKGVKINEDLYWTEEKDGSWTDAQPLENINTKFNEGSPCLSKNAEKLYFIRCKTPQGHGNCDIYVAENQGKNTWGNVQNLGKKVNSRAWDSHPSLSHTGDTLFFASDRLSGFGGIDIYYTYKDESGNWTQAQNVGPTINTQDNDLSPFYHPKHKVLYFSSKGHMLNYGNYDIYKSYHEHGSWTEPNNIGPIVNGEGNEYYFTIDAKSKKLFYTRSEKKDIKNLDLYSFPLPMEAKPTARTVLKGSLENKETGESFQGIVSVIDMEKGVEVTPKYMRPDGSFAFDLIDDRKYLLTIQGKEFFRIEKELDLDGDTSVNMETSSINFLRLQFESIEFKTGSAEILPKMENDLDKLMNYVLDNPNMRLKVSGHTDSRGDPELNLKLSQNRANAIKQYLINKGKITSSRIKAKGYGSKKPIIKDADSEEDHQKNRRVEFEILKSEDEVNPYKNAPGAN